MVLFSPSDKLNFWIIIQNFKEYLKYFKFNLYILKILLTTLNIKYNYIRYR